MRNKRKLAKSEAIGSPPVYEQQPVNSNAPPVRPEVLDPNVRPKVLGPVRPSVRPDPVRKYYINELSSLDQYEPETEPQRQHYIHKRNSETRARLRATSLCTLKAERQWIPVWREAQA